MRKLEKGLPLSVASRSELIWFNRNGTDLMIEQLKHLIHFVKPERRFALFRITSQLRFGSVTQTCQSLPLYTGIPFAFKGWVQDDEHRQRKAPQRFFMTILY